MLRGVSRVKITGGTTGPGAALWVEGAVLADAGGGPRADELAKEYKSLVISVLQTRGAWQVVDMVQQIDDPSLMADRAGYASYLTAEQKLTLLETADITERLEQAIAWTREHLAELDVAETIRKDVTEGMEKQQKEFLLRQQLAAVRKELDELTGDGNGTEEDDYRARVEAADLPEKVRETALRKSTSWSAPRTHRPRPAGSAPGSTRSSTSRGTSGPRTPTTSPARAACWMRTTPASTTSRSASSSTWPSASAAATGALASSAAAAPGPCSPWSARLASARPRSASPSPARWTASSSGSRSAACGTRRRSAATGAPTSARCPAASSGPSARRAR